MKKKLLALALTTAMLGSCMIAVPAQAENLFKWGDVTYDLDTGTVTKCETTASGSVSIPAKIKGTAVTSIATNAFKDCSGITSIAIPNSVTSIGNYAFSGCENLNAVHITDIAAWCMISFDDSSANPLYYAHDLYLNNALITEIVIPDNITSIGNFSFYNSTGLTSVTIPNNVTSIGSYAFSGCESLTSVTISDNVTSIGTRAFSRCAGLTSITIPDSISIIGESAFRDCTNLNTVYYNAINCSTMGSVSYPVFKNCSNLKTLYIGEDVRIIPDYAFFDCTELTSATISNSVTSIGKRAFSHCYGNNIYYNGTSAEWSDVNKAEDWNRGGTVKIYVLPSTEKTIATAYSTDTYTDNTANDGGATGFKAELPADSTSYKLGNVTWQVMSGNDIKSTAALSYGEMTVTSSPVIIGLVITGLYDPDAMALANYEKTNENTGYVLYTE